ncbi:cation efflux protein [Eremomyces bilateralis CBS 781.70]|uniref:Cation efflux protein n=1 Tax=Eremomyces bilateralis CBS 781.70 TaxID=1392243 RepID=A0A6G1FV67_9PEZI|nr:cation efflux protein [Eremomyces bilateralis CBS 781.70]KAF1809684.1 cation efflux protein [Eremomyces bilateralis CBS 781.70]
MALSKSTRIQILLAIDTLFFLLELTVGYSVHSLALVADAFHMLNDVLSLCVGLWAVKVATSKTKSTTYTYGWQRAETLGALVNGVFLVALCLSIFLEAIQRFVEPQEVSQPQLVLVVGCCGLASNILGLFLFHEHSHGPGGHGHDHEHGDGLGAAEEGHAHPEGIDEDPETQAIADPTGNIEDVLPESQVQKQSRRRFSGQREGDGSRTPSGRITSPLQHRKKHSRSRSRGYSSLGEIHVHPASFRNEIIAASKLDNIDSGSGTDTEEEQAVVDEPTEADPLLKRQSNPSSHSKHRPRAVSDGALHAHHRHAQPRGDGKSHSHSHSDLNMKGVFLHVVGDALGNIGVIASALIIWLTKSPYRFYSDPLISLIITIIILCSAVPLCKAASRILLQAVPIGLSVDDIKADITTLPGVRSCHHLHVWQLSDTKLVASLHVQVAFPTGICDSKGEGSAQYMALARSIRRCLHAYGIHSSTIQPEFCLESDLGQENGVAHHDGHLDEEDSCGEDDDIGSGRSSKGKGSRVASKAPSRSSLRASPDACLLECGDECGNGKQCCVPDRELDR